MMSLSSFFFFIKRKTTKDKKEMEEKEGAFTIVKGLFLSIYHEKQSSMSSCHAHTAEAGWAWAGWKTTHSSIKILYSF